MNYSIMCLHDASICPIFPNPPTMQSHAVPSVLDRAPSTAFPTLLSLGLPISPVIHAPILSTWHRGRCRCSFRGSQEVDHILVATFPVAPGLYGQPPKPPTLESKVRIPCSSDMAVFTSAWPYVSWKCIAMSSFRMPAAFMQFSSSFVRGAVPMPVVSPSEISSAPISRSDVAISATLCGSTSYPSKGQPSTTDM